MSYIKQNFEDKMVLTAAHLNYIENGLSTFRTINENDIQTSGGIEIPNARFYNITEGWKSYNCLDSIWEMKENCYCGTGGYVENSSYTSWETTITDATITSLYLSDLPSSNTNYFSLCLNRNSVIQRWRNHSDDTLKNLEGQSNALEIQVGDTIILSASNVNVASQVKINLWGNLIKQYENDNDLLTFGQWCYVEYATNLDTYTPEALKIYIPQNTNYAMWRFKHSKVDSTFCDTWRIGDVWQVSSDFSPIYQLTSDGAEWEMAVHLADRPDFIGGYAHGDEIYNSINCFIDGKLIIDLTSLTLQRFNELKIIVCSDGYDPNDNETKVLTHQKELVFSKEGVTVKQNVIWENDYDLTACYLAMMPPKKYLNEHVITDSYYTSNNMALVDFTDTDDSGYSINFITNVPNGLYEISKENGYYFTMEIPEYVTTKKGFAGILTDNSSNNYHKMYFRLALNGDTVESGERWDTITFYNIQC